MLRVARLRSEFRTVEKSLKTEFWYKRRCDNLQCLPFCKAYGCQDASYDDTLFTSSILFSHANVRISDKNRYSFLKFMVGICLQNLSYNYSLYLIENLLGNAVSAAKD